MPVNEFEKQVQQKMDELQLRPSTEVWEEVERRIRKERKRRGVIVWFFILAALLLGGAGWLFISGNKKESLTSNTEKNVTAPDEKKQTDKKINQKTTDTSDEYDAVLKQDYTINKIPVDRISSPEDQKTQTSSNTNTDKTEKSKKLSDEIVLAGIKYSKKKKKITIALKDVVGHPDKTKETVEKTEINDDQSLKIKETVVATNDEVVKKDAKTGAVKVDSSAAIISAEIKITKTNSAIDQMAIKKEDSLINKTEDKLAKTDTSKKKKNKWEFGVTAMGGVSNKVDGFSLGSLKNADAFQNVTTGGGTVITPLLIPSAPTSGFVWQTGLFAKQTLAKKISLSTGLNFSSYSTHQITGAFVDSSIGFSTALTSSSGRGYYRGGTTGGSHNNHYYFLEVPVSFHWQVNKGNKLPLVWQNGFAAGFFLGGNALVYNSTANVFYKDNKSFNKVQLSYRSGLYVKLFNKNNKPINVGVLFDYQLSKLQKQNIIGGNHLSSFGIQVGWLLKK